MIDTTYVHISFGGHITDREKFEDLISDLQKEEAYDLCSEFRDYSEEQSRKAFAEALKEGSTAMFQIDECDPTSLEDLHFGCLSAGLAFYSSTGAASNWMPEERIRFPENIRYGSKSGLHRMMENGSLTIQFIRRHLTEGTLEEELQKYELISEKTLPPITAEPDIAAQMVISPGLPLTPQNDDTAA